MKDCGFLGCCIQTQRKTRILAYYKVSIYIYMYTWIYTSLFKCGDIGLPEPLKVLDPKSSAAKLKTLTLNPEP